MLYGITKAACSFPSNVFWVGLLSPLTGVLISTGCLLVDGDLPEGIIPTKSAILLSDYYWIVILFDIFQIISHVRIHFMVQRYYKHMIYNAAPKAKLLASKYLKFEFVSVIFLTISHITLLISNPNSLSTIHYASLIIYNISFYIFSTMLNKLNYIKQGEINAPGFFLDYIILFGTIIIFPIYIYYIIQENMMDMIFLMLALFANVIYFMMDLKYIFFALIILQDKFLANPYETLIDSHIK
ncbi:hypothetical protein TVAG_365670 [Trichomonas vaginalis G3]|uniref:Uncharacterized protein n=1 Tax=Trichomonas vaginalis (strain ATCC PRA-98 / G3) TaxID=412133 RepID=A2DHL1_TRIV3|nr:hypothetical protein TVAGG3_0302610 [Trichomonas vaginalis G3]EAY20059.1 hypothetical protein TVAG_365670 [Trichomonas vaginalis G3]KAI5528011.1 hypothetical protein TVAGG3_0302610 [Trichomonas vaginalis G3]|eukprot:XP_001581045.1 hypothetical protein [Trichomonas vaginalis G3]